MNSKSFLWYMTMFCQLQSFFSVDENIPRGFELGRNSCGLFQGHNQGLRKATKGGRPLFELAPRCRLVKWPVTLYSQTCGRDPSVPIAYSSCDFGTALCCGPEFNPLHTFTEGDPKMLLFHTEVEKFPCTTNGLRGGRGRNHGTELLR